MKKIVSLLMCLALLTVLAGCKDSAKTEKVKIRWYVGLGIGADGPSIKAQEKFVETFNQNHPDIELVLEIIDQSAAYDTLATQMAAGNAPDIVGPVGIKGRDSFKGAWLDLAPLVKKHNFDLSLYDSSMIDFYRVKDEGLVGLPYAVYPSFIYYNKDLFDEAGIPYPPKKFGEEYVDVDGKRKPWNIDTLQELAIRLTVDEKGKIAGEPGFNPDAIVQFGFAEQYTDPRSSGALFGAGTFIDGAGKAVIPEQWKTAFNWYYEGRWKYHYQPFGKYMKSDLLGGGNFFESGNIAMVHTHLWYAGFAKIQDINWDLAVVPAYNGKYTAKMHADTFEIMKSTKNPDAAFTVMTELLKSEELLQVYGAMPAEIKLQKDFLSKFSTSKFPGHTISWDVVMESMKYPDNPSCESWLPNLLESTAAYSNFWNLVDNEPQLNLDKEMENLLVNLQKIYDAAR